VTARIFAPERTGKSSEWSCKIEVQGLAMPFKSSVLGVDSFQSLYLGLRLLCAHLENTKQVWRSKNESESRKSARGNS